jgi:predicted XRE-type DNA-binding protein
LRRLRRRSNLIKRRLKQAIAISEGTERAMTKKTHVVGSGNVFADLGHPRPAEALAKAELARKLGAAIERQGLTQAAAAQILEVDQPKVSALIRGRLAGFSLDRLVRFLVLLGSDVEIVVKPRAKATGRARVMVA